MILLSRKLSIALLFILLTRSDSNFRGFSKINTRRVILMERIVFIRKEG